MRAREAWQVLVGQPEVLEALLEGGVELDVVEGEPDLAGQLREHPVVLFGEVVVVVAAFDDQQPEQLAAVGGRGHAEL